MITKEQITLMNIVNELNLLINSQINLEIFKKIIYFYLLIVFYMTNNKYVFLISKKFAIVLPENNIFYKQLDYNMLNKKDKKSYGLYSMLEYFDEEICFYKDPKKYLYELKFINKKLINSLMFLSVCLNNLKFFGKIINNSIDIYLIVFFCNIYYIIFDRMNFLNTLKFFDKNLFSDIEIFRKLTFKKIIYYCQNNNKKAKLFLLAYICANSAGYLKKYSCLEKINDLFSAKYFLGLKLAIVKNQVVFHQDINSKIVKINYFC